MEQGRLEQLIDAYTRIVAQATYQVHPEFNELANALSHERWKFEENFTKFTMKKAVREVTQTLSPVANSLLELDQAESSAYANYRQMSTMGQLPAEKMPAHFEKFSLEDLIDLHLYPERRVWDAELMRRLDRIEGESNELSAQVEEQEKLLAEEKKELARRIEAFGAGVDQLRSA